jgi:hypothetical protein
MTTKQYKALKIAVAFPNYGNEIITNIIRNEDDLCYRGFVIILRWPDDEENPDIIRGVGAAPVAGNIRATTQVPLQ